MTRRRLNKIILGTFAGVLVLCGGAALLGALLSDDTEPDSTGQPSPSESQAGWEAEVEDADRQAAYQEALDEISAELGSYRDRPLLYDGENTCFDLAQDVEADVLRRHMLGRYERPDFNPDDELVERILAEAIPELCPSAVD